MSGVSEACGNQVISQVPDQRVGFSILRGVTSQFLPQHLDRPSLSLSSGGLVAAGLSCQPTVRECVYKGGSE